MTRNGLRSALCVAVLVAACGSAHARTEGDAFLYVGQKWLAEGDWAPLDTQSDFGVMVAFAEELAPCYFALDAFYSEDDDTVDDPDFGATRVKAWSMEFAVGVRKVWRLGATRPHLGAGGMVADVRIEGDGAGGHVEDDDRGYGVWANTGISWRIGDHLDLGIELRYSKANARLGLSVPPPNVAVGGFRAGLLIGYGW